MFRQLVRQAAYRLFRRRHLALHGPQAGIDAPYRRREQIPQTDSSIDDVILQISHLLVMHSLPKYDKIKIFPQYKGMPSGKSRLSILEA